MRKKDISTQISGSKQSLIRILSALFSLIFILPILTACSINGCSVCKHLYLGNVTVSPTCEGYGLKRYTCDYCGDGYDEIMLPTWHTTDKSDVCIYCGKTVANDLLYNVNFEKGVCSCAYASNGKYVSGELTIPSFFGEYSVTSVANYGFKDLAFTSVSLPLNLTKIGMGAFKNTTGFASVKMLGVQEIAPEAFFGSLMLSSVFISNLKTVGKNAFYACSNLSTVYAYMSKEEFENIYVDAGNDNFTSAKVVFLDKISK